MKRLKNNTVNPISIIDTGVTLPASPATYDIPPADYLLWAASSVIIAYINNGDISVGDGTSYYSPTIGLKVLQENYEYNGSVLTHESLSDPHTVYLKSLGRAGGQTLNGGTASGDDLILDSTTNATKGNIIVQPTSGRVGIGTITPSSKLHLYNNDVATENKAIIESRGANVSARFPTLEFQYTYMFAGVPQPIQSTSGTGSLIFSGNTSGDPAVYQTGARIDGKADGAISGGFFPGKLEFGTATSAGTNQTNLVIKSNGALEATQAVNYTALVTQSYHLANKGYVDNLVSGSTNVRTAGILASSSNTTLTNLTALQFTAIALSVYAFEYYILYQSVATTTGIVLSMGGTAVGTISANVEIMIAADGTAATFKGAITSFGDVVIGTGTPATLTTYVARITGVFITTTGGVVYPQFRSEVNGSAITTQIGSVGRITLIA